MTVGEADLVRGFWNLKRKMRNHAFFRDRYCLRGSSLTPRRELSLVARYKIHDNNCIRFFVLARLKLLSLKIATSVFLLNSNSPLVQSPFPA